MGNNGPQQFSGWDPEDTFFWIKPYVVCSEVIKGEAKIVHQCFDVLRLDDHVVYVCFDCFADLFFQACLDHTLVGSPGIFESERHSIEAERTVRCDERCCGLIRFLHLNLMVSGIGVEETQRIVSCHCVNDLGQCRVVEKGL